MFMTLSVLSMGEGFFNVIYTESQGLLGVETEENQMEGICCYGNSSQ